MSANLVWIGILRQIPADMQNCTALGLTSGSEIVIQRIFKMEREFMIIRGRVAGTQDPGRIVLIPYDQLSFVAVQTELKDAEVESLFSKGAPPARETAPAPVPVAAPAPAPQPAPAAVPATNLPPAAAHPKKADGVSKTVLLAKLRDRLKDAARK